MPKETVSVKGDRKKAAKKANATLEFKLADGSVVEFSLPVSYVKPKFKLTSASGTIKEGAESVLKTSIMVRGDGKIFRPYDMTGVTVSGTGAGSASKGADGSIEVKAAKAGKVTIKLETLRRYDVVTGVSMLVRATLKDVGGTVESVTVAEEGFTARPSGNGTILIGYSGDKYNKRNLNIGKLTLSFKISGIEEPVTITMKNVKAKTMIPSVKAATVIIPRDQTIAEGGVIGTANIVSSVYLSYGRYIILEPVGAKIVGSSKNVTARVNESDFKEINIEKFEKKSGWIKVRLTYKGDVTKTIKVKVKRAGK